MLTATHQLWHQRTQSPSTKHETATINGTDRAFSIDQPNDLMHADRKQADGKKVHVQIPSAHALVACEEV
ncbi:hypothetical protein LTR56_026397 [Elasticomyces elasticus]|nr:hypothetical protein LTR56_026397 [Elasticomyces elasticus]KAK4908149.1 hypothetical protein LTR49_022928 [Elasticomyces elasticus]KAK5748168.1 hypothetical protein LTS12_021768 [Elasticomyces elasticus]